MNSEQRRATERAVARWLWRVVPGRTTLGAPLTFMRDVRVLGAELFESGGHEEAIELGDRPTSGDRLELLVSGDIRRLRAARDDGSAIALDFQSDGGRWVVIGAEVTPALACRPPGPLSRSFRMKPDEQYTWVFLFGCRYAVWIERWHDGWLGAAVALDEHGAQAGKPIWRKLVRKPQYAFDRAVGAIGRREGLARPLELKSGLPDPSR